MLDLQVSLTTPKPNFHSPVAMRTNTFTTSSPSRILCLKLQELPSSGSKTKKRTVRAIAESFLKFSPRLVYRSGSESSMDAIERGGSTRCDRRIVRDDATATDRTLWLFIDIASTSYLFEGEEEVARQACLLSQVLGFGVQYAISDTPAGAQAFTAAHPNSICPQGEERDGLKKLSLPLLLHLEGVQTWEKRSQIESIVTFFLMIGFKTAGDLAQFSSASFKERWGQVGLLLWKRLNAQDRTVISPLIATEPLEDFVHLDFPISLVSLLIRHSEKSLDYLFARLQGRRLFAQKLTLTFHCEYSGARHKIEIEPNTPCRNQELFTTLLENRLSGLNLENPIRDFEVHVVPCEEKAPQLDFFEARESHKDKLQTLFSLLLQSSAKPGLFELQASIMPENSWRMITSTTDQSRVPVRPEDVTAKRLAKSQMTLGFPQEAARALAASTLAERSVAYEPKYGAAIAAAPRPTRLLTEPQPIAIEELGSLKILSSTPIERLEHAWWDDDVEAQRLALARDYYFAVSGEGQCLWIYQDLQTEEYFVHGYFD